MKPRALESGGQLHGAKKDKDFGLSFLQRSQTLLPANLIAKTAVLSTFSILSGT